MSEAKRRREAIEEMDNAGRAELAAQERYELGVIEAYLPKQLSRDEIETFAVKASRRWARPRPKISAV